MAAEDEEYEVDELYIGLTRPPMIKGITDVYAVVWMTVEVVIFVGIGGGKGLIYAAAAAPAIYLFGYLACLKDPRIFGILRAKFQHFSRAMRRKAYWGGSTFDPF